MKRIKDIDIYYIQSLCHKLPELLKAIQTEQKENDYIYYSCNRAMFDRIRLCLTKDLLRIRKVMY